MHLDSIDLRLLLETIEDITTVDVGGYNGISIRKLVDILVDQEFRTENNCIHACLYAIKAGMVFADEITEMDNVNLDSIKIYDLSPYGYKVKAAYGEFSEI